MYRDAFKKGDAYLNTRDYTRDIGFRHLQFVDRLGDTYRKAGTHKYKKHNIRDEGFDIKRYTDPAEFK